MLQLHRLKTNQLSVLFFLIPFLVLLWRAPSLEFYLGSADHGYQLSLGRQILLGKFPFVSLFFHYGPLTAFTSAFGLWVADSLISETIICALGYATAIFLIHYLSRYYVSDVAGWLTPFIGFLFLGRFYKWYYWLFPLLALYCLHRFLKSGDPKGHRWLYLAGILSGLGGLYRLDLGLACLGLYVVSLLGLSLKPLNLKRFSWQMTIFMMGFSLPFILWLLILGLNGGTLQDYLSATLVGGQGVVEKWSVPIPSFDWGNAFSQQSSTALAYVLIPSTYVLCILYCFWMWFRHPQQGDSKFKFMNAVSVLGLGIFPQALHRSGVPHLLQVLPPVLIAGSMLVYQLWWGTVLSKDNHRGRLLLKCLAVLYLAVLGLSGWGIRDYGGSDLTRFDVNPIPRYQELSRGIHSSLNYPVIRLISEVQNRTTLDDFVLVVPLACQLYYFAERPISGFINGFASGILDNDKWRRRNLEAIRKNPPAVVIVNDGFFSLPQVDMFRQSQPELYAFLSTDYSQIIYQKDGWMLLSKADHALKKRKDD